MDAPDIPRPRILLSFSRGYRELAQRIGGDLQRAHVDVRYDAWSGGGGAQPIQSVPTDLRDVMCVVPVLTPSDAAATWISDEWKSVLHDAAVTLGIPVLPVRRDIAVHALPSFLTERYSIADLSESEYPFELRRLVGTIGHRSGDTRVTLDATDREPPSFSDNLSVAQPLVVEFGTALAQELGGEAGEAFAGQVPMMLDGMFYSTGVAFPAPEPRVNAELPSSSFRIVIHGVPEFQADVRPGSVLVNEKVPALQALGLDAVEGVNPASRATCAWIPAAQEPHALAAGYTTWDAAGFIILSLSEVLRTKAADFLGVEETQAMLDAIEIAFPLLVTEVVPKTVPLFVLTDVLRRLLAELVSIRDLRRILLALADWGRVEQDPMMLTEYARAALRRQITDWFRRSQDGLPVLLLHPQIEQSIRNGIRHTPTGSYVDLEPASLRRIVGAIQIPVNRFPDDAILPPIVTTMEIRSVVQRLVVTSMPRLKVVSYQELRPDVALQPIGRIGLDAFEPRMDVTTTSGVPLWSG